MSRGFVVALLMVAAGDVDGAHAAAEDGKSRSVPDLRWEPTARFLTEKLEYAPNAFQRPLRYDVLGWAGGAYNRVFLKSEGTQSTRSTEGDTELQVLYGRLISPYWDFQIGGRVDVFYGPTPRVRVLAAIGVQGLAPGWFEIEPTLFVSQRGDVSAELVTSYDLYLTQRLVMQPRLDLGFAVQAVPEFGTGSGITNFELGLRMRYEFLREVAPYVGVASGSSVTVSGGSRSNSARGTRAVLPRDPAPGKNDRACASGTSTETSWSTADGGAHPLASRNGSRTVSRLSAFTLRARLPAPNRGRHGTRISAPRLIHLPVKLAATNSPDGFRNT